MTSRRRDFSRATHVVRLGEALAPRRRGFSRATRVVRLGVSAAGERGRKKGAETAAPIQPREEGRLQGCSVVAFPSPIAAVSQSRIVRKKRTLHMLVFSNKFVKGENS